MKKEQLTGVATHRDPRKLGIASTIPSWNEDGRGARAILGTAAIGIASMMIATDAAEAQQQGTSPLPSVQVDAPQARRAARPVARPAARPPRIAAAPRPVAAPAPAPAGIVSGISPANTNVVGTGLATRPGNIQSTPQTVNVITEQTIREQGVTTLEQALQNVPGVTVAVGEGGGGVNGDSFRIRGFTASNDLYSDGLRDFGAYTRDAFAIESVQVFKGPSSDAFGNGTVGGAINTTTKTAKTGTFYSADVLAGTGFWGRVSADINQQINANQAVRIFGMANKQDINDREHVHSDRYGAGISFATGLQTSTQWALNYVYQHNDRRPDYGVPMISNGPGFTATKANPALPVTEFGIPRSFYYGKSTDRDRTDAHILTSKFQHEFSPNLTFYNNTRLGYYDRNFSTSVPSCAAGAAPNCAGAFLAGGNPSIAFGGGNPTYDQNTWSIQNTAAVVGRFNTGPFRHEANAGIDAFYVSNDRDGYSLVGTKGNQPIRSPIFENTTGYSFAPNPWNTRDSKATSVALFASDRLWLTDQLSILGGVRWENYSIDYAQRNTVPTVADPNPAANFSRSERADYVTPKVAVIFEPWRTQNFYVSYAEAAVPPGQLVTTTGGVLVAGTPGLQVERTKTYEAGFKLNTPDSRIGFTGAVFQVTKNNALYADPVSGDLQATGERIRVEGVEAGVTGAITDAWTLALGYAYLDSAVLASNTATNIGNEALGVARNNVSLWTTYNLSTLVNTGPGRLTAGFGIFYRDRVFADNANLNLIPSSFTFDGMLSYEWQKYRVALNAYNITDELNYNTFNAGRAIPSAGRTVTVSGSVRW